MPLKALGYNALITRFSLRVPPLTRTFVVGDRSVQTHTREADGTERIELPRGRFDGDDSTVEQLTFALKREYLNLAVLAALFEIDGVRIEVQAWLHNKPMSGYARKAAYLAHWLTGAQFDYTLPVGSPRVRLLDAEQYLVGPEVPNSQFGVVNNLLGTREFSPLVRRTEKLNDLLAQNLGGKVTQAVASIGPEMLSRTVDYLYLSETRSTYNIEDEIPDNNRAAKFRHLLEAAGAPGPLTVAQLCEWQNQIVNPLSAEFEFRPSQNWLSRPGRLRNIADFIPPTANQVPGMMTGVGTVAAYAQEGRLDPVVAAACAAFGLVFVHPFFDGNGRLHRFLIHHVLRQSGFTPAGVVLPVSARMLKQLDRYATLLKAYSRPRTELLNYRMDSDSGTLLVDSPQPLWLYAYFDATDVCEFLLECCKLCVEEDLVVEVRYLRAHDQTVKELEGWLDMRQSRLNTLIDVIVQGHGILSKRKRDSDLAGGLTEAQLKRIEEVVSRHFAEHINTTV